MGIFNNNLVVDKEKPFKNDRLQRELEVKNLTSMFNIVDNQMVLAINSQWGTGKTSFLKMWNQYLTNEGYKTILFNAWENDYVEEPFIAFVDEIRERINDENRLKGFMERAKDVSLALFKQSPKIASKIIKEKTGVDSEELISNDELNQIVSDKIENYNKSKNSVHKFKIELEKIADKEFDENGKPIIIFVDELDRCRPDYAISLLERIKHFFNVQNIIFILGIDKEALSNSIRVIYGEQTDVNGYLTRFIDIEYKLRENNREDYLKYLFDKYGFEQLFNNRTVNMPTSSAERNFREFEANVIMIVDGFKPSLRDIEKFIVELYMILKANTNNLIYPRQLILLCMIKRINKKIYTMLKFKEISYEEFLINLKEQNENIENWLESMDNCIYKAYLIWFLDDSAEINKLKEAVSKVEKDNMYIDKDVRCLEVYDYISQGKEYFLSSRNSEGIKARIFSMVELYDKFAMITL